MMSWVYLVLAIGLEVSGTICMKLSAGFTRPLPSVAVFVCYGLCLAALVLALKRLDLSLVYAVWAGLGTALVALAGICWFGEPAGPLKIASLAAIVAGVVGLSLSA